MQATEFSTRLDSEMLIRRMMEHNIVKVLIQIQLAFDVGLNLISNEFVTVELE